MKKLAAAWLFLAVTPYLSAAATPPPQVQIRSGGLRAKIYLPDKNNGFYRATRFDWSGIIFDLEFAGHHLYKPWFTSIDQDVRDFVYKQDGIAAAPNSAMTGPVEEFQKPIGYDTARPGETFLKVGVGLLRKADDTPYQFAKHFELVDGGTWTVHKTSSSVTFQQVLGDAQSNYGYVYTKTLRLEGKNNQLIIEHSFKNTGRLPIVTVVYDHNFLTVDDKTIGPDYSVSVPYSIKPNKPLDPRFVKVEGNRAEYIADIPGEERAMFNMQGFSDSAKDYDFTIINKSARLQINIKGDQPLANANVWAIRNVIGVEPFINVNAAVGREFSWKYVYTYNELPPGH
jgi:hypothetical protein